MFFQSQTALLNDHLISPDYPAIASASDRRWAAPTTQLELSTTVPYTCSAFCFKFKLSSATVKAPYASREKKGASLRAAVVVVVVVRCPRVSLARIPRGLRNSAVPGGARRRTTMKSYRRLRYARTHTRTAEEGSGWVRRREIHAPRR